MEVTTALFAFVREEVDETMQVSLKENIFRTKKKSERAQTNLTMNDFIATSGYTGD